VDSGDIDVLARAINQALANPGDPEPRIASRAANPSAHEPDRSPFGSSTARSSHATPQPKRRGKSDISNEAKCDPSNAVLQIQFA